MKIINLGQRDPMDGDLKLPESYLTNFILANGVINSVSNLEDLTKALVIGGMDSLGWEISEAPEEGTKGRDDYIGITTETIQSFIRNETKTTGILYMTVGDQTRSISLVEGARQNLVVSVSFSQISLTGTEIPLVAVHVIGPAKRQSLN